MNENQCYKFCANFKPKKSESPFPNTLRTADLHKGMLVEDNLGEHMVIVELLEEPCQWMKVFVFGNGYACEDIVSLADNGCQRYEGGGWNRRNWLREVKI